MIRLEGVTRRFRTAAGERTALDAVDLSVTAGEVFGVVGRSGAGKSTLVRTINLLERPDAGRVWVGDQDLMGLKPAALRAARRRIGMIFQHFNLLHSRTIRDNVALPLVLEGRPRDLIARRVDELMERLGLAEHARKYPAQLSGGQSSASASPAPWPANRRSCCATRRPARSIPRRPRTSCPCWTG